MDRPIGPLDGDETWQHLYEDLKRLAHHELRQKNVGGTFSPTMLVHETYVKLLSAQKVEIKDRGHFIALCCRVMRQVLVNHFREKGALKRGENAVAVTLEDHRTPGQGQEVDLFALEQGLARLEAVEPRLARIVEMRFFGGLDNGEIARALEVNTRTVERGWLKARMLLSDVLSS